MAAKKRKPKSEDKIIARGFGLKESEWKKHDEHAALLGVTPHSLSVELYRQAMILFEKGELSLPIKLKKYL